MGDNFDALSDEQLHAVESRLDFSQQERLRAVINELGWDKSVLSAGKSEKQLKRYLSGDDIPLSVLSGLGTAASISLDWIAYGERRTPNDRHIELVMLTAEKIQNQTKLNRLDTKEPESTMLRYALRCIDSLIQIINDEEKGILKSSNGTKDSKSDLISLPFLDIEAAAGAGAVNPVYEITKSVISFERSFLRGLGALPDSCKIISARGDSMSPTIPDGALIVIDHSQRDVVNGWISVVNVCGDLLVKRVRRRLDGTVELVSDNPIYPVEAVGPDRADQLIVIGRVVYFCRAP